MKYIVLDTNLWYAAQDNYTSNAMTFLHILKESDNLGITLDYEELIINEYNKQTCCEFIRKWIYHTFFNTPSKIYYTSSQLNESIQTTLTEMKFEVADQAFVGLALNSDKIIITEDSDYGKGTNPKAQETTKQQLLSYLISLGLIVLDYTESKNEFRNT